jgi:hypothetical protein
MSFLRFSPKNASSELHVSTTSDSKETEEPAPLNILIPFGMLLAELDHTLSVGAFDAMAKNEGKKNNWEVLLPLVLKADAKLKAGGKDGYTEDAFILELRRIFDFTEITTDADIRAGWNAMLGDLSKLSAALNDLIVRNKGRNIILMSGTNVIHVSAIHHALGYEKAANEVLSNPMKLRSIPYYVSFLQKTEDEKLRSTDTNLIEEIIAEQALDLKNTVLLLSLTSNSKLLKKGEEAAAARRKEWAEKTKGMTTLDFNRNDKLTVAEAIDAYVAVRAEKQKAQAIESNSPNHLFYYAQSAAATQPKPEPKPTEASNLQTNASEEVSASGQRMGLS